MAITQTADFLLFGFAGAAGVCGAIGAGVRAVRGDAHVRSLATFSAAGGAIGGGLFAFVFLLLTDAPRDAVLSAPIGLFLGGILGTAPGFICGCPLGLFIATCCGDVKRPRST